MLPFSRSTIWASIRAAVKIALSGAGFNVTEATNGVEGIAKAKAGKFDLIVTDLNMPVMDGLTMIEEIRKSPAHRAIPIILLTTESDAALKNRARAAGATGWLTKPFEYDQIIKIVKKVLGQ